MFYICRFSDNWLIYDTANNKSRPLEKKEIDTLSAMFGGLLEGKGKILSAVKVESISPNKLLTLPITTGKEE